MSWSETLLDASFRGVRFDVQSEDMENERAIAQHGVPYRNGDDVEDLGRGARQFPVRAVLWGDDYESALQALLEALDMSGPGELVHPIYGSLSVMAVRWKVSHKAEPRDYVVMDLQFIEHSAGQPFFERTFSPAEGGTEVATLSDALPWQAGVRDLLGRIDSLVALIQQVLGGGWVGLVEAWLGLPGIALRLSQLRSQILGILTAVNDLGGASTRNVTVPSAPVSFDPLHDAVRTPVEVRVAIQRATPTGATSLLARDSVPAEMPGVGAIPGEMVEPGNTLLERIRRGQPITAESVAFPPLPHDPIAASGWAMTALIITELALARATEVATVLEDDTETRALAPDDLEQMVGIARSLIEGAILAHRSLFDVEQARRVIEPLRNIAALLQARARQIILLRPPLIERTVASRTCLRLIAHHWYGDHHRATELLRLNGNLRAPNALESGDVLRGYAE